MWRTALGVVFLLGCDSGTTSTLVDAGLRHATVPSATTTSQPCDATHTLACTASSCCGPTESCVIALVPVNGGAFCGSCPAEFPAACTKTTCCRSKAACNLSSVPREAYGTCKCEAGETACGDLCCPVGSTCVSGACRSCPASAPTLCGTECRSGPCDSSGSTGGSSGACSPSTGCGNGWLNSCDNRCYPTSGDCSAAGPPQGCYSGSCRQCP